MNKIAKELSNKFFKSVDESINDKLTKRYGGIPMQEFTFEITNIYSQRSMEGVTNITAICVEDKMMVSIEIKNSKQSNKEFIKQELIKQHTLL